MGSIREKSSKRRKIELQRCNPSRKTTIVKEENPKRKPEPEVEPGLRVEEKVEPGPKVENNHNILILK